MSRVEAVVVASTPRCTRAALARLYPSQPVPIWDVRARSVCGHVVLWPAVVFQPEVWLRLLTRDLRTAAIMVSSLPSWGTALHLAQDGSSRARWQGRRWGMRPEAHWRQLAVMGSTGMIEGMAGEPWQEVLSVLGMPELPGHFRQVGDGQLWRFGSPRRRGLRRMSRQRA